MEFENNAWIKMLKSAHKTSLIQDGKFKCLCRWPFFAGRFEIIAKPQVFMHTGCYGLIRILFLKTLIVESICDPKWPNPQKKSVKRFYCFKYSAGDGEFQKKSP